MFFRIKPAGERRYLQIVENSRDGARTVQRVPATLDALRTSKPTAVPRPVFWRQG